MKVCREPRRDAERLRFGVVVSRFNHLVSVRLLEGCTARAAARAAAPAEDVHVAWVPGAFEIPLAARALALTGRYDAIVDARRRDPRRHAALRLRLPRRHRRRARGDARHRRAGRVRRAHHRRRRPGARARRRERGQQGRARRRRRRSRWRASLRRARGWPTDGAPRESGGRGRARSDVAPGCALQVLYALDLRARASARGSVAGRVRRASRRTSSCPPARAPSRRSWCSARWPQREALDRAHRGARRALAARAHGGGRPQHAAPRRLRALLHRHAGGGGDRRSGRAGAPLRRRALAGAS